MTARIYVADLAAYNNGILHGQWLDASQDLDTLRDVINAMLESSPIPDAEEYAIHDYEGFYGYQVEEYSSIKTLHEIACFLEEHNALGGALLEHWCGDLEMVQTALEEDYYGTYESLADYAQELTESCVEIPASLQFYIDYDAMARDMKLNGDVYTLELAHGEIHVFCNR